MPAGVRWEKPAELRAAAANIIADRRCTAFIFAVIVINAACIGIETYPASAAYAGLLHTLDRLALGIFTAEIALKLLANQPWHRFFRSGWNLFDFLVVAISFVPLAQYASAARLVRVFRVMRAITFLPELRLIIGTLLRSIPSLGYIIMMVSVIFYIYAVIGTMLFGGTAPAHFGSLHQTFLTLFTMVTLEGWVNIMDAVLPAHGWAWFYFISFILIATYIMFNLFIGVIVNNLQEAKAEPEGDAPLD